MVKPCFLILQNVPYYGFFTSQCVNNSYLSSWIFSVKEENVGLLDLKVLFFDIPVKSDQPQATIISHDAMYIRLSYDAAVLTK